MKIMGHEPGWCSRCGGWLYLDTGDAEFGIAPSQVCRICSHRVELNLDGTPLEIQQPTSRTHSLEQRIRVMYAQGMSATKIARELHCNRKMVLVVLQEAGEVRTRDRNGNYVRPK